MCTNYFASSLLAFILFLTKFLSILRYCLVLQNLISIRLNERKMFNLFLNSSIHHMASDREQMLNIFLREGRVCILFWESIATSTCSKFVLQACFIRNYFKQTVIPWSLPKILTVNLVIRMILAKLFTFCPLAKIE